MRKYFFLMAIMFFALTAITGCGNSKEQQQVKDATVSLTIASATSLKDVAEELKDLYVKQHPGVNITYNFASSGTLQKQIEEGAPADMFISAGKSQMDALAVKGLIVEASRKDLLGNELVLVAGKDSKLSGFDGLTEAGISKISMCTPETVPAGEYAREVLTSLKLWDKIQSKLVLAKDVRQVLTYVETGNVDAGLLYRSDVLDSKNIKIVAAATADLHQPIVYPIAVIKSSKHQQEVEEFVRFLQGDEATQLFTKYGFKPLGIS